MAVNFVVVNAGLLLMLIVSFIGQWHMAKRSTSLASELVELRKLCSLPDYMALVIVGLFAAFLLLALVSKATGGNPAVWLAYVLLLAMLLALCVLCVADKNILAEFKKHKALAVLAFGLLSAGIPYLAAPIADSAISEFTGMEAALFPRAQHVFVLIMSLLLWPMALSIPGLLAVIPLILGAEERDRRPARKARRKFMKATLQRNEKRKEALTSTRRIAVLVALLFTLTAIPTTVSTLVSGRSFSKHLKQVLVFSSFHLPAQTCGISDQVPENAKVVQIRLKIASVAIPEAGDSYRFDRVPCEVPGMSKQPGTF